MYSENATEARVNCNIIGQPLPLVRWFKDNELLVPSDNLQFSYNVQNGEVALKLTNLTSTETISNYTVEAENEFGRAVGLAQIAIQAFVRETSPLLVNRAPRITPLQAQIVKPGETLIFTSQFEGFPRPEVKWLRNGKEIMQDDETTIVTENNVSTIVVCNVVRQKAGKYEISVTNEAGESRSSASVTLSTDDRDDTLKAPEFIKPLYPKCVLVNEVVILETIVESNPASSFQWFYNNTPIQITPTMRISSKENKSVLIVEYIAFENSGSYTCRAENVLGSVTSTVSVRVVQSESQLEEINEYISPRFIEKLKPVQLMDGDALDLRCRVIGYPTPKIQWLHNKQPIIEVKGIELLQDSEGLCVLTIPEVFPEDGGEYSCYATNKFGKARSKTHVIVEGILGLIQFIVYGMINKNKTLYANKSNTNTAVISQFLFTLFRFSICRVDFIS